MDNPVPSLPPQTAAQTIPVPIAPAPAIKPAAPKPTARQDKPQKPPGWWSLPDLSGSLAGVLAAVEAASDVPAHWREAIKIELSARCSGDNNFVWLDAHYFIQGGKGVLHLDIEAENKLL